MKKVDVICPVYINATIGPTGTLRRLLANKDYLIERGYEIEIFTYDYLVSKGNAREVDFSKGLSRRSQMKEWIKKSRLMSMLFVMRNQMNARRLVKLYAGLNRNPDIVVFHETNACYAYLKKVETTAKKVCFFHTDGKRWEMFLKSYPKLKNSCFLRFLDKQIEYIINNLDRFVFIANIGRENFLKENPSIKKEQTICFHNGIEDKPIIISQDQSSIKEFKYRLCCTGTICKRKGQYLIIEALRLLDKKVLSNIHLSLFGGGPDLISLQKKVIEYGLNDNVTFAGNVDNKQIHEKLCHENIYILMSDNEGLPISIIEAMRVGLPIISTNVSGIPEQVENLFNGILVEPNVESLLEVLNSLSNYDWKLMGKNSRERFEKEFSFDQMKKAYCDMLDTL